MLLAEIGSSSGLSHFLDWGSLQRENTGSVPLKKKGFGNHWSGLGVTVSWMAG